MVALSAGAVARQLGISPATLRTWARRYGLEPSVRSEGSHRRYTPEDIDRLVAMQRLMRGGVPVAEAAAQVRGQVPVPVAEVPGNGDGELPAGSVRSLWEAALALDGQRCAHLVADAVRTVGVLPAWQDLVVPVLQRAGEQWQSKHVGIDVEHVLSDAVTAGLFLDTPVKREGVLLAATGTEDHVLPLYALRAALAEDGIGAELLTCAHTGLGAGRSCQATAPGRDHPVGATARERRQRGLRTTARASAETGVGAGRSRVVRARPGTSPDRATRRGELRPPARLTNTLVAWHCIRDSSGPSGPCSTGQWTRRFRCSTNWRA